MSIYNSLYEALNAEFPRMAVQWRAGSTTKDKTKAMALAYLDARAVAQRLDDVLGFENWQDRYEETPMGKTICYLSIRINDEWITKADGAGDTNVEAAKGAISDALKRAACRFGVGRYLYEFPSVWVKNSRYLDPAECWREHDKAIESDSGEFKNSAERNKWTREVIASYGGASDVDDLIAIHSDYAPRIERLKASHGQFDKMALDEIKKQYTLQYGRLRTEGEFKSAV